MKIEIKAVTEENQKEIMNLHVKATQATYVETVAESLAEAKSYTEYIPASLYRNDELVGFAMYGLFENEGKDGRVWLDRFFIDEQFQGQGLGSILLSSLLEHLERKYRCKEIYLSVYEHNQHALRLYEKFGFYFTGELDVNGEKVMVKKL